MLRIENVSILHNDGEFISAAVELIEQASRYIRIRSAILDPDLFDNREVNDALSAFARKSRYTEVHILLDLPGALMKFDHSTLAIIRRLSQKVIVRQYYDKPDEERETTLLVDHRGVLVKYPEADKAGYFSLTDAVFTRHACEQFEYDWERSAIAHELREFIL